MADSAQSPRSVDSGSGVGADDVSLFSLFDDTVLNEASTPGGGSGRGAHAEEAQKGDEGDDIADDQAGSLSDVDFDSIEEGLAEKNVGVKSTVKMVDLHAHMNKMQEAAKEAAAKSVPVKGLTAEGSTELARIAQENPSRKTCLKAHLLVPQAVQLMRVITNNREAGELQEDARWGPLSAELFPRARSYVAGLATPVIAVDCTNFLCASFCAPPAMQLATSC